jgi:REP element-mobilizing transposase RayT
MRYDLAMPATYSRLLFHIVFATKNRDAWFDPDFRLRLHPFIGGCIRNAEGTALEVGGVADHVHILAGLRPTHRLADVVRDVKRASSEWIHTETRRAAFAWQEGYSAFSVGPSELERVRAYIHDQDAHHRGTSFQDEVRRLLAESGIDYDERFLW